MRPFRLLILLALFLIGTRRGVFAQTVMNTDTIGNRSATDNLYNKALFSDSLSSSFCIVIKKEVKSHKHVHHSEQVTVLDGEGHMRLDDRSFNVRKGDVVFIPKNAVHSVKSTGKVPLKIMSVQSPFFDGSDRVCVDGR